MTVATKNVLNVILLYVKPNVLCSFFITHELDMFMNFKYSSLGELMGVNQVANMLYVFPNMVLTGLYMLLQHV